MQSRSSTLPRQLLPEPPSFGLPETNSYDRINVLKDLILDSRIRRYLQYLVCADCVLEARIVPVGKLVH
jgi:hypothetical protein